jgi:hypothetical protein
MPHHLAEHLAAGRHLPGILVLNPAMSFGALVDELILIALASSEDEFIDQMLYLPLT